MVAVRLNQTNDVITGQTFVHSTNTVLGDGTSDTIVGGLVSVVSGPAILALFVSSSTGDESRSVVAGIALVRARVAKLSLRREKFIRKVTVSCTTNAAKGAIPTPNCVA